MGTVVEQREKLHQKALGKRRKEYTKIYMNNTIKFKLLTCWIY